MLYQDRLFGGVVRPAFSLAHGWRLEDSHSLHHSITSQPLHPGFEHRFDYFTPAYFPWRIQVWNFQSRIFSTLAFGDKPFVRARSSSVWHCWIYRVLFYCSIVCCNQWSGPRQLHHRSIARPALPMQECEFCHLHEKNNTIAFFFFFLNVILIDIAAWDVSCAGIAADSATCTTPCVAAVVGCVHRGLLRGRLR